MQEVECRSWHVVGEGLQIFGNVASIYFCGFLKSGVPFWGSYARSYNSIRSQVATNIENAFGEAYARKAHRPPMMDRT